MYKIENILWIYFNVYYFLGILYFLSVNIILFLLGLFLQVCYKKQILMQDVMTIDSE